MIFKSLSQNISTTSHNDIDFVYVIQNDIDVISLQKCTHSYNNIEIVHVTQNDIDVILVLKYTQSYNDF